MESIVDELQNGRVKRVTDRTKIEGLVGSSGNRTMRLNNSFIDFDSGRVYLFNSEGELLDLKEVD